MGRFSFPLEQIYRTLKQLKYLNYIKIADDLNRQNFMRSDLFEFRKVAVRNSKSVCTKLYLIYMCVILIYDLKEKN